MSDRLARGRGFTLVELMAVVAIIGLISAMVALAVGDSLTQTEQERVKVDLRVLEGAVDLFRMQAKRPPRTLEELWVRPSDVARWGPAYVKHPPPRDPWGRVYLLERGPGGAVVIKTLGADGAVGGEGANADRTNGDLGDPSW